MSAQSRFFLRIAEAQRETRFQYTMFIISENVSYMVFDDLGYNSHRCVKFFKKNGKLMGRRTIRDYRRTHQILCMLADFSR